MNKMEAGGVVVVIVVVVEAGLNLFLIVSAAMLI